MSELFSCLESKMTLTKEDHAFLYTNSGGPSLLDSKHLIVSTAVKAMLYASRGRSVSTMLEHARLPAGV